MFKQLVIASCLFASSQIFANVQVCNKRDHRVYTSMAYSSFTSDGARTTVTDTSIGWWGVDAGNCLELINFDAKRFLGGKFYLYVEADGKPEMKNAKVRVCYNPADRFEFSKTNVMSGGLNESFVPQTCNSNECSHLALGECSKLDFAYGGEKATSDLFEEHTITDTNWTIDIN